MTHTAIGAHLPTLVSRVIAGAKAFVCARAMCHRSAECPVRSEADGFHVQINIITLAELGERPAVSVYWEDVLVVGYRVSFCDVTARFDERDSAVLWYLVDANLSTK